jgi:uncharacterized protein HemY
MLACRTVVLVALITAQRTQTIQFLDISNMTQDSNGITFYLNKLTKTDKHRPQLTNSFTENPLECNFDEAAARKIVQSIPESSRIISIHFAKVLEYTAL